MHEITIISGKGGTGKTSLTAAWSALAENHIICDLDVDAPDLHLLLDPDNLNEEDFYSGHIPTIDAEKCTSCGQCAELCAFKAIHFDGNQYSIDPTACEGCKVCVHFCPAQAINWEDRHCGRWFVSNTRFGLLVHAQLFPGQENSGRLVTLLRNTARELAKQKGLDMIVSDGTPGIGCPVISSLSGTNLVVIVTEPTVSGRHDLERVADLCDHFRIPAVVVINKSDINPEQTEMISETCTKRGIEVAGLIPFDPDFTHAMVNRQVISEYTSGPTVDHIDRIWTRLLKILAMRPAA